MGGEKLGWEQLHVVVNEDDDFAAGDAGVARVRQSLGR
jgi:hypothetical protein